jgi:tetratricopeptide (TPR) repeat protein
MSIKEVWDLFSRGKYSDLFLIVEKLTGNDRIEGELLKAHLIHELEGDYDQYKALVDFYLEEESDNIHIQISARFHKATCYFWESKPYQGDKQLEIGYILLRNLPQSEYTDSIFFHKAWYWHLKGTFLLMKGKRQKAIESLEKAVSLSKKPGFPVSSMHSATYNQIGIVYMEEGEYDVAYDMFEKSILTVEEDGNEIGPSIPLWNLARIQLMRGEVEAALNTHKRGIAMARTSGWTRLYSAHLQRIAWINYSTGKPQKAIDQFEEVLTKVNEKNFPTAYALARFSQFQLYLDLQDSKKTKECANALTDLAESSESILIETLSKLTDALYRKEFHPSFVEKANAQTKLRELITNERVPHYFRIIAMLHLVDLLLLELRVFEEERILNEILELSDKIQDFAQVNVMIPIECEALILRGKLALLEGSVSTSEKLLQQALDLAQSKGLKNLETRIAVEYNHLQTELAKWMDLIERNAPLKEKIKHSRVEDYLKQAIKLATLHSDQSTNK